MRPRIEPCDIEDVIGTALRDLKDEAAERSVSIDIAPGLPLVPMDFVLIEQVLVNLLDNALKYSPRDAPIVIRAQLADHDLAVTVSDRGPGIPNHDLAHLFGILTRRSINVRGRHWTRAHDLQRFHRSSWRSHSGVSRVPHWHELPILFACARRGHDRGTVDATDSRERIFVVDDEPAIRRLLRASLTANGYSVDEAGTGEEIVQRAPSVRPDLILLDIGLPGINGVEVTRCLREWTETPIIMLSVRDQEDDKIAALDAGADDYLTKPFTYG